MLTTASLMKAGSDSGQAQLKRGNRRALIRQLRLHPGLCRAELAAALGLTKSTVSALTRELIDEGWLVAREVVATGDLGRRPTPLFIDPDRLLLLGAEVGLGAVRVVLTSLTGDLRASHAARYDSGRGAGACIETLAGLLVHAAATLGAGQRVIGVGVGLPGGVDAASGRLVYSHQLGWHDLPFGALLHAALRGTVLAGVPVAIQNDADAAALGEAEFNPSPGADPLIFALVGLGVGAGVVVGGRLLTGARGLAGEVGHMVLQGAAGPRCSCGRQGCVEAFIGAQAVLRAAGQAIAAATLSEGLAALQGRLAAGERPAVQAVASAGRYLGVVLQNLAAAYDPACIVLGGPVIELGDALLAPAAALLNGQPRPASQTGPRLRVSRFGADAVAMGAAAGAGARHRLTQPSAP